MSFYQILNLQAPLSLTVHTWSLIITILFVRMKSCISNSFDIFLLGTCAFYSFLQTSDFFTAINNRNSSSHGCLLSSIFRSLHLQSSSPCRMGGSISSSFSAPSIFLIRLFVNLPYAQELDDVFFQLPEFYIRVYYVVVKFIRKFSAYSGKLAGFMFPKIWTPFFVEWRTMCILISQLIES